jgi:hypothetical protein
MQNGKDYRARITGLDIARPREAPCYGGYTPPIAALPDETHEVHVHLELDYAGVVALAGVLRDFLGVEVAPHFRRQGIRVEETARPRVVEAVLLDDAPAPPALEASTPHLLPPGER